MIAMPLRRSSPRTGAAQRSEADLRNEPVCLLPAWAFEKLLARAWSARKEQGGTVLEAAFPPGTPLVHIWAGFPRYKHLIAQETLARAFAGWNCRVLGQDGADGIPPPRYCHIEASPTEKRVAYDTACLAFSHPDGHEIAAYITVDMPEREDRTKSILQLTAPTAAQDIAFKMMEEIEAQVLRDRSLKGHRLDAFGGFIRQEHAYSWDCVFADPKLLGIIRRNTQGFLDKLDLYREFKLPTRRGVLLHGRPGTGKTLIGNVLCSQLQHTFIWVRPGQGVSSPFNPSGISSVFDMARDLSPTLIFFEDLDLAAPRRSRQATFESIMLGELMNQLDGLRENEGIVVVATTNDLEAIEPALRDRPSRFDCVIEVPEITDDIRRRYLRAFLSARGINGAFYDEIDQETTSCRTIAEVQEQTIRCLQRAIENGLDPSAVVSPVELPVLDQPTSPDVPGPIGFRPGQN